MSMSPSGKKCLNRASLRRHTGTCVNPLPSFPNGGELTITPLAGEAEEYTAIAGDFKAVPTEKGATHVVLSAGAMHHSRVPANGTGHFALKSRSEERRVGKECR